MRASLEPPPQAVARTVAAALQAAARPGRRLSALRHPALVGTVILVAAILIVSMWRSLEAPSHVAGGVITNEGDIIVIEATGRPITLIDPAAIDAAPSVPMMSIELLGESQ